MLEKGGAVSNCEGGLKETSKMASRGRNTRQRRGKDEQLCAAGLCMRSTADFLLLEATMAGHTRQGRGRERSNTRWHKSTQAWIFIAR